MFTFNTVSQLRTFAAEFNTPLVHATAETSGSLLDIFRNACVAFSDSPFERGREWALALHAINAAINAAFSNVAARDASLEIVAFLLGDYMVDATVIGHVLYIDDLELFSFRDQYQMQAIMTRCGFGLANITYDDDFTPTFTYKQ